MHLSLNGWPSYASHAACLLLGLALAHVLRSSEQGPALPANAVVVSLPPARLKASLGSLKAGSRVHVLRTQAGLPPCRLSHEPALLLAVEPLTVLGVKLAEAALVPIFVREARAASLWLRPFDAGAAVPACVQRQRVTYGGN